LVSANARSLKPTKLAVASCQEAVQAEVVALMATVKAAVPVALL